MEIRLDRRQAFYAVIGSLLIVSVAFVVGLIVGQRMQFPGEEVPTAADDVALRADSAHLERSEMASAGPAAYTFYDELRHDVPRPLLIPAGGGVGDPVTAMRRLERTPTDEVEAPPPEPAIDQERTPQQAEPPEPPSESEVQSDAPLDDSPTTALAASAPHRVQARRLTRRSALQVGSSTTAAARPALETVFFTVDAGRFATFSEAASRRNQLRASGLDAIVTILAPRSGGRHYRVQIGSYRHRAEADEVAAVVAELGISATVIRES